MHSNEKEEKRRRKHENKRKEVTPVSECERLIDVDRSNILSGGLKGGKWREEWREG